MNKRALDQPILAELCKLILGPTNLNRKPQGTLLAYDTSLRFASERQEFDLPLSTIKSAIASEGVILVYFTERVHFPGKWYGRLGATFLCAEGGSTSWFLREGLEAVLPLRERNLANPMDAGSWADYFSNRDIPSERQTYFWG